MSRARDTLKLESRFMPRARRLLIIGAVMLFVLATALSFNAFGSHSTEMHIFGIIAAGWSVFALAFTIE